MAQSKFSACTVSLVQLGADVLQLSSTNGSSYCVYSKLLPGAGIAVDESKHALRRGARSLQPIANAPMATEQQASFVLPTNYVENHQYFQGNQSTVFRRGIKAPHYDLTHFMNAAVRKNVNIKSTGHD